jgi:hypothetical protein
VSEEEETSINSMFLSLLEAVSRCCCGSAAVVVTPADLRPTACRFPAAAGGGSVSEEEAEEDADHDDDDDSATAALADFFLFMAREHDDGAAFISPADRTCEKKGFFAAVSSSRRILPPVVFCLGSFTSGSELSSDSELSCVGRFRDLRLTTDDDFAAAKSPGDSILCRLVDEAVRLEEDEEGVAVVGDGVTADLLEDGLAPCQVLLELWEE